MSSIQFKNRLIKSTSAENEWVYLVNGTYAGEKTIVPLLNKILKSDVCTGSLKTMVEKQIDEEVSHVRLYHNLVGSYQIDHSRFRNEFSHFFSEIPTITQKLFALQGMLEGIALGSLYYRFDMIENSPSLKEDRQALEDELNHIQYSFPHLKHLIEAEGKISIDEFKETAKKANEVFSNNFNSGHIQKAFAESFNEKVCGNEIEHSQEMVVFRKYTIPHIIKTRNEFINQYFKVTA